MAKLEIFLLGPFQVQLNGATVTGFESIKVRALLAYLAAEYARPQPRERLATLLWPDWPQQSAMSNLRYALADLRKNIGDRDADPPFLLISRESIQLNLAADLWVDVAAFGDPSGLGDLKGLEATIALYRSPFLEGFSLPDSPPFEEWLLAKREYFSQQVQKALQSLADHHEQSSEYDQAQRYVRRQLDLEPWREEAHQQLMRLLALQGQRSAALVQYEKCRRALKDGLGVEPGAETVAIYERIREGSLVPVKVEASTLAVEKPAVPQDEPDHPPMKPPEPRRNNLPVQLTSFIGRKNEIVQVQELLRDNRMVTLTGSGGVGKTRLALQVTASMSEFFKDGWLIVDLSSVNAAQLPLAILSALGLRPEPNKLLLVELEHYFGNKTSLLILDNCEHLVEACAQLSHALLRACPILHILATSREALGVAGETTYLVPPLSIPPGEAPSLATLLESDAGKLFAERARSVLPSFAVDAENAFAIAQVCRRLDGIPLAIELAAARVNLLSVEEIAVRLNDQFRLLTGGSRTALPKHQTLRGMIDWSWDLLAPSEKAFLSRLSVFAGGWTLEAAEALNDRSGDTLDLLASLTNKSLLVVERPPGRAARFRMLESIRQYGQEKLAQADESIPAHTLHRDWFLALAESADVQLKRHDQLAWFRRLEMEHDNLRAALEWSLSQADTEATLRLVAALGYYWAMRGYTDESQQFTQKALELADKTQIMLRSLWRARVLHGPILVFKNHLIESPNPRREDVEQALQIYRELGDRQDIANALLILSSLSLIAGDTAASQHQAEASLALMQEARSAWGIGACLFHLMLVAETKNEWTQLKAFSEECVTAMSAIGDRWCLSYFLAEHNWIVWDKGETEKARLLFEENLQIYRDFNDQQGEVLVLSSLALMAMFHGDYARARQLLDQSIMISRHLGDERFPLLRWALGDLALCQGSFGDAQTCFEAVYRLSLEDKNTFHQGASIDGLARLKYYQGDYTQARLSLEAGLAGVDQASYQILTDITRRLFFRDLGDVARAQGEIALATGWYQKSLALIQSMGSMPYAPEPIEGMAKTVAMQGQHQRATRLFAAAQAARDWMEIPMPPINRPDYERSLGAVREVLGEETFTAAWAEGSAMPLSLAIQYALEAYE